MRKFLCVLAIATAPCLAWAQPHAAVLSDADQADLKRVEAYIDGLPPLKGRFQQVSDTGATATGTVWLVRPGKMRFEYDPPSPLLLVAGHGLVVVRDNQQDQTSNLPLSETPLGLLLRDHVSLSGDVTVTDFRRDGGQWRITVVKTDSPGIGTLTLVLNAPALALTGWSVVDAEGRQTRVSLSDVTMGGDYPGKLFTFIDPHFFDGGNTP